MQKACCARAFLFASLLLSNCLSPLLKELFLPFSSLLKSSLFVFILYLRFTLFSLHSCAFLWGLHQHIPLVRPTFFLNSSARFFLFHPLLFLLFCCSACLAHVLPRARLVFGFFVLFFRFFIVLQEMKIYSLLTMKNEKRRNPSRFSFIFAVEQFKLKTKQSFILKHTML